MKIRSITCFMNPGWPLDENRLQGCADLIRAARAAFSEAGYEVQTARLATPPFSNLLPVVNPEALVRLALALEESAGALGIQYVSLGPAFPDFLPAFEAIPAVISATSSVFHDRRDGRSCPRRLAPRRTLLRRSHQASQLNLARWICQSSLRRPGKCPSGRAVLSGCIFIFRQAGVCPGIGSRGPCNRIGCPCCHLRGSALVLGQPCRIPCLQAHGGLHCPRKKPPF